MAELEQRLGVSFRDPSLALRALTHKSVAEGAHAVRDNQRLEFLGDAVLQLAVSNILYRLPTELSEGDLTRYRAHLVNSEALLEIADDLGIARHARIGKGLPARPTSVFVDCVEALLGAIFLDQSFSVAHRVVERLVEERLRRTLAAGKVPCDPKSRLQQYSLAQWSELPRYDLIECSGENPTTFRVRVMVGNGLDVTGVGHSKKAAEQDAARHMLEMLDESRES